MPGVRRFEDIFDEIEDMFEEMNKEFEREFESLLREVNAAPTKGEKLGPIVYGWSVVIGPEGKPIVRQFGNTPRGGLIQEREPLVDVNETDNEVLVIAEMPGVDKSEIKLNATEDTLEIKAEKKYYRLVELPVKVIPDKAKASYKNGVLEVRLTKRESSKPKGVSINIE
ncbi:MAG: archaeal heat shock protein Hsp20 [Thermoprotei archaeon]